MNGIKIAFTLANWVLIAFSLSAQNVGIGTAVPLSKLHVEGNSASKIAITLENAGLATASDAGIYLKTSLANSSTLSQYAGNTPGNRAGDSEIYIKGDFHESISNTSNLIWNRANGGTEIMRLTGVNGDCGIGTASPNAKLEVSRVGNASVSATALMLISNDGGGAADYANIWLMTDGNQIGGIWKNPSTNGGYAGPHSLNIGSNSPINIGFIANNQVRIKVMGNGRVGIGTIAPQTRLHVSGDLTVSVLANTGTQLVFANAVGRLLLLGNGSAGQVLKSAGLSNPPVWTSIATPQLFQTAETTSISVSNTVFADLSPNLSVTLSSSGSRYRICFSGTAHCDGNELLFLDFTIDGVRVGTVNSGLIQAGNATYNNQNMSFPINLSYVTNVLPSGNHILKVVSKTNSTPIDFLYQPSITFTVEEL
ncbi:MAG TPA: hypothetical protein ENJ82_11055 [Bacteroidetes bacterium]|nr:hypothetical protein [Bacteroidota bacterium]